MAAFQNNSSNPQTVANLGLIKPSNDANAKLGFNGIIDAATGAINTSADQINAQLANYNPTDPGSLLQMQQCLANYNLAITVTSSLIKSLEDTVKSVAQKLS